MPESMRNAFLLTDYRGAATKCQSLVIKLRPDGSSFKVFNVDPLVEGLAASDVELGYDGNLYFADYGGGWSANRNGTIQVLRPVDDKARRTERRRPRMFEKGFPIAPLRNSRVCSTVLTNEFDRKLNSLSLERVLNLFPR